MSQGKKSFTPVLEVLERFRAEATEPARERYLLAQEGERTYLEDANAHANADDPAATRSDAQAAYATAKPRRRVIRARIAVD
jgi:hypothetical protein